MSLELNYLRQPCLIQPFQADAEDVFICSVVSKCSVNRPLTALFCDIRKTEYLVTVPRVMSARKNQSRIHCSIRWCVYTRVQNSFMRSGHNVVI